MKMKKQVLSILGVIVVSSALTATAFAENGSIGSAGSDKTIKTSVDEILAAKRVVISPVSYQGYLIEATADNANEVCQFLGFYRSEVSATKDMDLNYWNEKSVSIGENEVRPSNKRNFQFFTSLTCLK